MLEGSGMAFTERNEGISINCDAIEFKRCEIWTGDFLEQSCKVDTSCTEDLQASHV